MEKLISIIGLIITAYTAYVATQISKKANEISKNSLRPYLDIILGKYEEKTYIKIANNGLGTAIIKEMKIKYKEKNFDSILDLLKKYFSPKIIKGEEINFYSKESFSTYVENLKNRSIAPKDSIMLLEKRHKIDYLNIESSVNHEAKKISSRDKLRRILSETTITIVYSDIFEEEERYFHTIKKLDFLGENI